MSLEEESEMAHGRLSVYRADAWGIEKCYCIWVIAGLRDKLETGVEVIRSEKFNIKEGGDTEWQLNFLLRDKKGKKRDKGKSEEESKEEDKVEKQGRTSSGLYLELVKGREGGLEVQYRIGILARGEKEEEVHTPKMHKFNEGDNWGMPLPCVEEIILKWGPRLTLLCEMTAADWTQREDPTLAPDTLAQDLSRMAREGKHADAKVTAADGEAKVHRALLWARLNWEESNLDLAAHSLAEVEPYLEYLYSGNTPTLQMAGHLLALANKLGPESLARHCILSLYKKMKLKNASLIFEMAFEAGVESLKSEVLKYMIACPLSVKLTDWEEFRSVNQDLAMKVLMAVSISTINHAIQ